MMYLLDTNHCSLIILKNPTTLQRLEEVGETNIATTIITAGELIYMAENSTYREQNLTRINEFLDDIRIYYIDEQTARIYGKIKAALIKQFGPKPKTKRKTTKTTELGFVDTDRFGRTVADLYTDSGLVQLQQTRAGWVWANARYKSDCSQWNAIAAAEKEARAARRGIWAGNPMPPWEWRRQNR